MDPEENSSHEEESKKFKKRKIRDSSKFSVYNFSKETKKSAYSEDLERIKREKLSENSSQQASNKYRTVKLDLIGFEETHPLLRAAFLGDFRVVKECISQGVDVNYRCNVNSFTALQLASQEGHTDIVKFLLDHGAQINERNRGGDTALALACLKNRKDVVRLLIERGCCVNTVNNSGWTPLSLAARYGDAELFTMLLRSGADTNCPPTSGWSLIHHPFGNVNPDVLELFKANLCSSKEEFRERFPGQVDPLLIYNEEDGGAPLIIYAARNGSFEAVKFLVEYGVPIDQTDPSGWTALMYTIRYNGNDARTVEFLIKHNANVNQIEKVSLWRSSDGWTPFLLACAYASVEIVKILVEHGANVKARNNFGFDAKKLVKHWRRDDVKKYLKHLKKTNQCLIS
jgi:ankyrin repeat protein